MKLKCAVSYCDNEVEDFGDKYCYGHRHSEESKTFAEQMQEASQTIEARMKALETDVKLLKRELGLK